MLYDTGMWYYTKEIRISIFSLVMGLFLLSGINPGFSQDPLPEISDEDLELIEQYIELAEDYFEENEFDVALSFYELVLEIDPSDIDALNGRELVLESIMSKIEPLPEISDEDLDLLEEFFEQAEDLFDEENYEEAISFYDGVLEIDSTDYDALFGKAFSLDNIGKHSEAILFYDKVLEIDSTDFDALNGKAHALHNIGKHEEAILFYDKVLEIDSTDIDALFGKALSLESLGREEEAISNLEKIETLIPPQVEFRVPPEGTVNQEAVEDIAEFDQTLFVIIAVFIVILISIIVIDFFARRRKSLRTVETP